MTTTNPADYRPALAELLRLLPLAPLGPGKPHQEVRARLETIESAFLPGANRDMVAACRAGLWLGFDFLDESHQISQDLDTVEGSYWHAILHRREPDAANAMYWFRRVGEHPVLDKLRAQAPSLGYKFTNPQQFVDCCERVRGTGSDEEELVKQVQLLEWQLLFDFCYLAACGPAAT